MYKFFTLILVSCLGKFNVRGQETKHSIYYEFNDSIENVLRTYLEAKYLDSNNLFCEIDFIKEDNGRYMVLYFSKRTLGYCNNLDSHRFIKIYGKSIPVYFNIDGYLYQNPADYEFQQKGEYPLRRTSINIYDGDSFAIDLETGEITHRDMTNNIIP